MLLKRLIDMMAAAAGLILLSPLLILIAALVRWSLGSPVLFRQLRPGLHGKPFVLYKFRTMRDEYDRHGRLLHDQERLTPMGRFLRNTSLDELPELYNVLKGELSLVGPRPLRMAYLERYTPEQRHRHDVMPGITGWAQINGRNALTWQQKFDLDLWYVRHRSLWVDVKILAATVWTVVRRDGIEIEQGNEEFLGTLASEPPPQNAEGREARSTCTCPASVSLHEHTTVPHARQSSL
jgi:sugar transferase EpsL